MASVERLTKRGIRKKTKIVGGVFLFSPLYLFTGIAKKMKTKLLLASVGIAILLCSVFLMLLPLPRFAPEQEQAVKKPLGIYGNANEDEIIDMRDLTYVKRIFFGKKPETELSDAKYDGKINPLDFVQIKLIIVGKEKQLTLLDDADRIVTVNKPVERIICDIDTSLEVMRALDVKDRMVGVSTYTAARSTFFPELSKLPGVMDYSGSDYEKIYELDPDILITFLPSPQYSAYLEEITDKLEPGIKVLAFEFQSPKGMVGNVRKLGYILDKREEAEGFIAWYEGYINTITEGVEKISEEDKPRVYFEYYTPYYTFNKYGYYQPLLETAGGINIAADLPSDYPEVDEEWVIVQNPDIIVHQTSVPVTACGYDEDDTAGMKALRDTILNRSELTEVDAVKSGKVYVIDIDLTGGSTVVGTAYLAKWFYLELFSDLDPQVIHQEYLSEWQGLDYDLDEHGVFVYPPLE